MTITRAEIRTEARAYADQDDATFPTDAQYNAWIRAGARFVYGELISAGWPAKATVYTFSDDPSAALDNCYMVQAVFKQEGTRYTEVPRIDAGDKAAVLSQSATSSSPCYEVVQDPETGVILQLYPSGTGTFRVEYISEFGGLAADIDSWAGPPDSYRAIALYAAAMGTRKEGRVQDSQALKQEMLECLQGVKDRASWVDQRNPGKIRDVMKLSRDPFAFDALGPNSNW